MEPIDPKYIHIKTNGADISDLRNPKLRDIDAKRMWDHFKFIEQQGMNILTESEFEKFKPLYQKEFRKSNDEYTPDQLEFIQNLSKEFTQKINLYRPIHIVADYDKNKVLYVLPAIFQTVRPLRGKSVETIDVCQNMTTKAFDQPWHVSRAVGSLTAEVIRAHDRDRTMKNNETFAKQIVSLHSSDLLNVGLTENGKFVLKDFNNTVAQNKSLTKPESSDEESFDDLF